MSKLDKALAVTWILLILLIALSFVNFVVYIKKERTVSDIREIVRQEVDRVKTAQLNQEPIVYNGKDGIQGLQGIQGKPGLQGVPGVPGVQGLQGVPGEKGDKGDKGDKGEPGDPGEPGKTPEFRCNKVKNRFEYRYVGDESWKVLGGSCVAGGNE